MPSSERLAQLRTRVGKRGARDQEECRAVHEEKHHAGEERLEYARPDVLVRSLPADEATLRPA